MFKVKDVLRKIAEYTAENEAELPLLEELCFKNGWDFKDFYDFSCSNERVRKAVSMLLNLQKVNLIKNGIQGSFNKPIVLYLLEQLKQGYGQERKEDALRKLDELLISDERAAAGAAGRPDYFDGENGIDF